MGRRAPKRENAGTPQPGGPSTERPGAFPRRAATPLPPLAPDPMLRTVSASALALLASSPSAFCLQATLIKLDPAAFSDISPAKLNSDGTVAIGALIGSPGSPSRGAMRWEASTGAVPVSSESGPLWDVSADGSVIAGSIDRIVFTWPFRWTATGGVQIIAPRNYLLSAMSSDASTHAGVSPTGKVVRWTELGGLEDLFTPASPGAECVALSADGSAIAGATTSGVRRRPFLWTAATGPVFFAGTPVDSLSPKDLSEDGLTVVGTRTPPGSGVSTGFVWSAAQGLVELDQLPAGANGLIPASISGDGQMVVGWMQRPTEPNKPFVWNAAVGAIEPLFGPAFGLADPNPSLQSCAVSVSADGNAILGYTQLNLTQREAWIVYLSSPPSSTVSTSVCSPASTNSTGLAGRIEAVGTSVAAFNDVRLRAQNLPPGQFGLFLASRTEGSMPLGAGTLCLGPGLGRFNGSLAQVSTGGFLSFGVDLTRVQTAAGPVQAVPGETWYFQAWHRDAGPAGATSNLTDAARVRVY